VLALPCVFLAARCASTPLLSQVRIVSWNINSLRKRESRLLEYLAATRPDVVCLQETKCADEQFPALALRAAGYHTAFHGQKSYNGVAILARTDLTNVRASLCDEEEDAQARVVAATAKGVRVYCIYAPNGQAVGSPAYEYKLRWYARLTRCVRSDSAEKLVLCGDFNVAPADADVFDPELWRGSIMCSDGERAAFRELCADRLIDTLRLHHHGPGPFTWWDYRMLSFPKDRGLRIDAVLAGKSLAACCTAAGVDREMRKGKDPSDHAPIWAELDC
jgi:exodeoxyribonuclease-3